MSTPSLDKLINVIDRLKLQMSELQALREAVAKVDPSYPDGHPETRARRVS